MTYLCDHSLVCCRTSTCDTVTRIPAADISLDLHSGLATAVKYTRFCGDTVLVLVHGCRDVRVQLQLVEYDIRMH